MTLNNKYIIKPSSSFEKELDKIYNYIFYKFESLSIANKFYKKVTAGIFSLKYFPERYVKISNFKDKSKNLRKVIIDNYVIIYEVKEDIYQVYILHIFHGNQNYLNLL